MNSVIMRDFDDIDCPTFVNFETISNEDTVKIESYFDRDHENVCMDSDSDLFSTPMPTPAPKPIPEPKNGLRRSSSMTSLCPVVKTEVNEDMISNSLRKTSTKSNKTSSNKSINSCVASNGSLNKFPIRQRTKDMAQQRSKSHTRLPNMSTPTRFHSKPKSECFVSIKPQLRLQTTIPQSPALLTKHRQRPVLAISSEQQQVLEFEEKQKSKAKAKPVSSKVLEGPQKGAVPKKPNTIFKPFNITSIIPKKFVPVKSEMVAPNLRIKTEAYKDRLRKNNKMEEGPIIVQKLCNTVPVPFSFEKRDEYIQDKREKMLAQLLEEEKRGREFKARPMPASILRSPKNKPKMNKRHASLESLQSNKSDEACSVKSECGVLKARTLNVWTLKPFEPKKEERPPLEIKEFQLSSERRGIERAQFDEQLKQKEKAQALIHKQVEDERIQWEAKQLLLTRKLLTHTAQPIRKFKEVKPIEPKNLTQPITPKITKRSNKNKENEG